MCLEHSGRHAIKRLCPSTVAAFLACLLLSVGGEAATLPRDTQGLLAFKAAMGYAPSLDSWQGDDPCGASWDGIYCSPAVSPSVVMEVHLNERSPKLAGTLPGPGSPFWNMSDLTVFDIMWNQVSGGFPEEIAQMSSLQLILVNGNQLSGPLPRSLGKLQTLDRIQIDENQFSGPLPEELGDLPRLKHLHCNNNSLSGPLPAALGKSPKLLHILVDNNNLSGPLPPEISNISTLTVLQLDNNKGIYGGIPDSYRKLLELRKLSLRNCSLNESVPDLSDLPNLFYIDLSANILRGQLPTLLGRKTSTVSLSFNRLDGPVPPSYAELPNLQVFLCESCGLNGTVPPFGATGYMSTSNKSVINLQRNSLAEDPLPQSLVNGVRAGSIRLYLWGNVDLCESETRVMGACKTYTPGMGTSEEASFSADKAKCACADFASRTPVPDALDRGQCVCGGPLVIGLRLKSPSFSVFQPYVGLMESFLANVTGVDRDQVSVAQFNWVAGPRLNFTVQIFPKLPVNVSGAYPTNIGPLDDAECNRIYMALYNWQIPDTDLFGPYENVFFTKPFYKEEGESHVGALGSGIIVAVVLGCVVAGVILGTGLLYLIYKLTGHPKQIGRFMGYYATREGAVPWTSTMPKVRGCQVFTHEELKEACNGFKEANCVGFGAYGHVFKGTLRNGDVIAVKVPDKTSWQGKDEFETEIELLSRVHHRNLVNLVGFCCETNHEALVYEFVPGGTLKQYLYASARGLKQPLPFLQRVIIALESAQAVNYLHSGASPPIIHRDIKTGNILLDKRLHAKVADFGLSKKTRDPYDDGMSRKLTSLPKRSAAQVPRVNQPRDAAADVAGPSPNGQLPERPQPSHNLDMSTIKGTPGYLDPEYYLTRQFTAKSDVYSFGVVLAELATGKNAMFALEKLFDWFDDDEPLAAIIDPNIGRYPSDLMHAFVLLSKHCVNDHSDARPHMADVIRSLEAILQQLPREAWETRAHSLLRASATPSSVSSASSMSFEREKRTVDDEREGGGGRRGLRGVLLRRSSIPSSCCGPCRRSCRGKLCGSSRSDEGARGKERSRWRRLKFCGGIKNHRTRPTWVQVQRFFKRANRVDLHKWPTCHFQHCSPVNRALTAPKNTDLVCPPQPRLSIRPCE